MDNIRNFCIIAHIDHGKSTLADRLLEATKTVEQRNMKEQFLDSLDLEKERGITIKLKPVRMNYSCQGQDYILNLIDTPGHVDFSYEVSRSLAACEGALLLVDATQGVQAQTISNVEKAFAFGLKIIPIVNKIDMVNAKVEEVALEMARLFNFSHDDFLFVSAKSGEGVNLVLEKVIKEIPSPKGDKDKPFRALVFDSSFDDHLGVVSSIRVVDGSISKNTRIAFYKTKELASAINLGYMSPEFSPCNTINCGEVGVLATGLKDIKKVAIGDTVCLGEDMLKISPLPGYLEPKPIVFLGIYPSDSSRFLDLRKALDRLKLTDASLTVEPESGGSLGFGFKCGFLGLLHAEIIQERIEREYGLQIISTTPTVEYLVTLTTGELVKVRSAGSMPEGAKIAKITEPICDVSIYVPYQYLGGILDLCAKKRGKLLENNFVQKENLRARLRFLIPLSEMITDFYDLLKSVSSGFASLDYEILGYEEIDAVKLNIVVAGVTVDSLSRIVYRQKAVGLGRDIISKLKETLPKKQFPVALQASIGGTVIARETIPAMRKTVTQKLYGGDVTRKNKLLDRQKEGKARLKEMGRGSVQITKEAFWKVVKIG